MEDLEELVIDITATGEELWRLYGGLQIKMAKVLDYIKELELPPVKTDILKNIYRCRAWCGKQQCRSEVQ